jgi:hypothetical protein
LVETDRPIRWFSLSKPPFGENRPPDPVVEPVETTIR